MKKKIRYTDENIGEPRLIADFLPAPDQLVLKDDTVKVTIALSRSSVEFFKGEARKHHTPYQKMIRHLLDAYSTAHTDHRKRRAR
jgi:predicted DNA binding CopG/RHH family protein